MVDQQNGNRVSLHGLYALRLKFRDVPITLVGASPYIQRLLKITKYDKLFRIGEGGPD